jgi:hypothetical protein
MPSPDGSCCGHEDISMEKTAPHTADHGTVHRPSKAGSLLGGLGLLLGLALTGTACEKFEGEGGSCTLVGKVYVMDYNGTGQLVDEYYAPDERVFIIYGQDSVYADEMRTNFDGTFRFQHLYKGDYRVFAYSECDTCGVPDVPVTVSATFTKNQESITTADIVIRK